MKKSIIHVLLVTGILLVGCNNEEEAPVAENDRIVPTSDVSELQIINTYTTEFGTLDTYFSNEEVVDQEKSVEEVTLTIPAVEYGKVTLSEQYSSVYSNLADEEGKITYVKAKLKIDGADALTKEIVFYPYQATLETNTGATTQAESTFSDMVAIQKNNSDARLEGEIYFLIDTDIPIKSVKITALAPFTAKDSTSLSDDLLFDIDLNISPN